MSVKLTGPMRAPTSGLPDTLVVLLHGYGSDGNDLIALAPYLGDILPQAIFVAPNAPTTCDINPSGFQWFAIDTARPFERHAEIATSRPIIGELLADLWAQTGLTAADTILGGFSQGGMLAIDAGLRLNDPIKAIVSFSGGAVAPDDLPPAGDQSPKLCLVHGDADDVVPVSLSANGHERLQALGYDSRLHVSPGCPHSIAPDGLEFVRGFVSGITAESKS